MQSDKKWIVRYLDIAKAIGKWSKDPSSGVGSIAVKDNVIISQGFNGFPSGVSDDVSRYENKPLKYRLVVHSELNCILSAARNGVSLKGADLYVSGIPVCCDCAKAVIQSGIKRVFMIHKPMTDTWAESFEFTKLMFTESGIEWVCFEESSGGGEESSKQAVENYYKRQHDFQKTGVMDAISGRAVFLFRKYFLPER